MRNTRVKHLHPPRIYSTDSVWREVEQTCQQPERCQNRSRMSLSPTGDPPMVLRVEFLPGPSTHASPRQLCCYTIAILTFFNALARGLALCSGCWPPHFLALQLPWLLLSILPIHCFLFFGPYCLLFYMYSLSVCLYLIPNKSPSLFTLKVNGYYMLTVLTDSLRRTWPDCSDSTSRCSHPLLKQSINPAWELLTISVMRLTGWGE